MPVASNTVPQGQPIQGGQAFPDFATWRSQNPGAGAGSMDPLASQTAYAQAKAKAQQAAAQAQQQNQQRQDYMLPGFAQRDANLNQTANQALQQQAPQLGPAAQANQYGGQTNDLVNYLQGAMTGQQPSLAQAQYRQASDDAFHQQLAMAAGARPGDAVGAARAAAQNMGGIQQGMGAGLAQAGIQERMGAAGALGSALGMANQNQQFNAGQQNQFGMANAANQLQNQAQQQGFYGQLQGLGLQNAGLQQQGSMGYQQNLLQRYGIDQNTPGFFDKLMSMGSSVLGANPFGWGKK